MINKQRVFSVKLLHEKYVYEYPYLKAWENDSTFYSLIKLSNDDEINDEFDFSYGFVWDGLYSYFIILKGEKIRVIGRLKDSFAVIKKGNDSYKYYFFNEHLPKYNFWCEPDISENLPKYNFNSENLPKFNFNSKNSPKYNFWFEPEDLNMEDQKAIHIHLYILFHLIFEKTEILNIYDSYDSYDSYDDSDDLYFSDYSDEGEKKC